MAVIDGDSNKNTLNGSSGDDVINGYDGNDKLNGKSGDDQLTGGTGNDALNGGYGSDKYHFSLGDGQDTIFELDKNASSDGNGTDVDTIVFGEGIALSDLTFKRLSDESLTVSIGNGLDRITIDQFFNRATYRIEAISFYDGSSLDASQIINLSLQGSDDSEVLYGTEDDNILDGLGGDDTIFGGEGDDDITGGTGSDYLCGEAGSDTYHFSLGDGIDAIYDNRSGSSVYGDVIVFGEGITAADLIVRKTHNGNLVIGIEGTDDSIEIRGFVRSSSNRIETVEFSDNSTLTATELLALANQSTEGDDYITGTNAGDVLDGLAGNDKLEGLAGDDEITGGTGNDILVGGAGSDTYYFAIGDGQDTIYDHDSTDATDVILFGTGITAEDLTIRQEVDGDMAISIAGSTDKVTVIHHFLGGATIERIDFADGASLTAAQIEAMAAIGTSENDYLTGTIGKDTLDGKGGNDIILGLKGDDDLTGGTGNDDLTGGTGADTYRFNLGDGKDTIYDRAATYGGQPETDTIVFGSGISASDVTVRATMHHDLVLSIANSSDKITVSQGVYGIATRIEQVKFDDGTTWNIATIYNLQMAGTEAVDYIYGTSKDNVISALGGNDYIWGRSGSDILIGGSGRDRLYGEAGTDTASYGDALAGVTASLSNPRSNTGIADGDVYSSIENLTGSGFNDTLTGSSGGNVIDGGLGNDTMTGGAGRDTFMFGAGYGKDTITDFVATQKKHDLVDLSDATGIDSYKDLMKNHVKDVGSDVLITAADGATLRIQNVEPGALAAYDFLF